MRGLDLTKNNVSKPEGDCLSKIVNCDYMFSKNFILEP